MAKTIMRQGLIHVYTGDGKGKTTAALGLILRASGYGMRTVLVQFLKGRDTGELSALANLRNITVLRYAQDLGFFAAANEETQAEMVRCNNALLSEALRLVEEGLCDLLVLDEICAAYNMDALDKALADKIMAEKPAALELVLTGRGAPPHFIDAADYVTECKAHKHPYSRGIDARKGVEF